MSYPASIALKIVGLPTSTHKMVLCVLADHADNKTWSCNPSVSRIAKLTGIKERQARKIIGDLEALGFITRGENRNGGKPGNTCHYLIHKQQATTHGIKKRSLTSYLTSVSYDIPTHAREDIPTHALENTNPCTPAPITPALTNPLTNKELSITLLDIKKSYGERWKSNPIVVAQIGASLNIHHERNEANGSYADRIEKRLQR